MKNSQQPVTHELKTWTKYFYDVLNGSKPFELRLNDRDFKVGDVLKLREYDPDKQEYSGLYCKRKVTYVLEGGQFGLEKGYVIMGLKKLS